MNERDLFIAALQQADRAKRAAFLDQACGADTALRGRLEVLLRAFDRAGGFLNQPAAGEATGPFVFQPGVELAATPAEETCGAVIGRYKLLQQLGEGGMGSVFLAEQQEPVRRLVALKIIKAGMDSHQVVSRFEAERQALALMDHPHIAKVLDGGTTASGRPYFVMELVKGIPITKYCDQEHLSPQERLALFIPVCQAVQHAHHKGIIHRDLKPSNVLIGLYDGRPVPKVIDFGVAKATQQRLTEHTLFTEVGRIIGTLEYMAPEQAELNNLDIDTRADVYSLGVLLYELLTGSPPFSGKQLRSAAFTEMLRMIREVEPPRPSTRLSSSHELPNIAARRKLEPRKLTKLVQGDLDWIVMKCLEKDRSRRYETANGLALDVQRYLADEPVLAGPPTAAYRLRKFLRRHQAPVLAAAVVVLALVAGVIGTTIGLLRANHAEDEARANAWTAEQARRHEAQERQRAEQARANEEKERRHAQHAAAEESKAKEVADARRRQAEAVANLLQSLFQGLDPRATKLDGLDVKDQLLARLEETAAQLERQAADPLTQARLQHALGMAFLGLGEADKAVTLLQRSLQTHQAQLGPDHRETLNGMNTLAHAYRDAGRLDLALPLFERTLAKRQARLGPDDSDTLNSMNSLAAAYLDAGEVDLALPLLEQALEKLKVKLGPDHHGTLTTMTNLAEAYRAAGKFDLALPLHQETLQRRQINFGPDHLSTLECMNNLASAYQAASKLDLAITLFEQTLDRTKAKLGPDHPLALTTMNNLASAYQAAGKLDLARSLFDQVLQKQKARLGPDHPSTLITMDNLAGAY
jgi:hypothetical protein